MASEGQEAPIEAMALSGSGRGSDYLFPDGSRIRTCEHVLAALTGLGVWGARLEVDGVRIIPGSRILISTEA